MAQEQKTEPCGCAAEMVLENLYAEGDVFVESRVEILGINYCPMHAIAHELMDALEELRAVMHEYEMDVEGDAPPVHLQMMARHKALTAQVDGEE